MRATEIGLLRFREAYFERIWGGQKLRTLFGKEIPDRSVGEAWLVSDHGTCESVVAEGPREGQTLRQLLARDAEAILGSRAQLTIHGRFPLLLKLIDANQVLSVQVHPDDACAKRLGERDVGKTEMWHVLQADPGSELICGLDPAMTVEDYEQGVGDGAIEQRMARFEVRAGDSLFVPAGAVHAIGGGIVLAEIQQNSDLTYRIYDWGRVDDHGQSRELHVDKAREAIHFGQPVAGPAKAPAYDDQGARRAVLAACPHFAAELVEVKAPYRRETRGESFHIALVKTGVLAFSDGQEVVDLRPGQAVVVPGCLRAFEVAGHGAFLDYYVPGLRRDIVTPLEDIGCDAEDLAGFGASWARSVPLWSKTVDSDRSERLDS